ncbi:immunity 52 family protein [Archangium violaceum]|uniref:immunity 52 family protein n=1 Tax=Archangium violaceum TaxID=83451 RepID=UPI00193BBE46|nr:immunity 52 family protein [Archangium violaceum]QRK10223.1 immunity 52 family protein [Archangium violaceum]
MSEPYYAAAYWGCRPESAQQCARRAENFFRLLATCHADYARWYEKASSTQRALQLQFEPTFDTFVRFFSKKKHQLWDDGFSFGAWTGHVENQGGMLTLTCGSLAEAAPNNVLLYFPSEPPGWDRLVTLPVLTSVMRAMVQAWEPDWAVAAPRDLREHLSPTRLPGTFVGWLTYYSRQWGEVPTLPEPVRVESVEDKGALVVLTPERISTTNPEHVALSLRAQQSLEERGLLREILAGRQ